MSNILIGVKKFISNKNVVTVLGVVLIIGIIYFSYNQVVKDRTNPIPVFVASKAISPNTKITKDMVKRTMLPAAAVTSNVWRSEAEIVGKYTSINSVIPAGSLFYKEVTVAADARTDAIYDNLKEGEKLYNFPVDIDSSYSNTIIPGSYVDIYMKAVDDNGEIMVGKLLENVKILSVKDRNGNDVFSDLTNKTTPAYLFFSVKEDVYILLKKAKYLTNKGVELFPAPLGVSVDEEALAMKVSTQYLRDFINAHTVTIDETPVDDSNEVVDSNEVEE